MSEEGEVKEAARKDASQVDTTRKDLAEKRRKARDAAASFEERLAKAERDVEEIKEKLGMK